MRIAESNSCAMSRASAGLSRRSWGPLNAVEGVWSGEECPMIHFVTREEQLPEFWIWYRFKLCRISWKCFSFSWWSIIPSTSSFLPGWFPKSYISPNVPLDTLWSTRNNLRINGGNIFQSANVIRVNPGLLKHIQELRAKSDIDSRNRQDRDICCYMRWQERGEECSGNSRRGRVEVEKSAQSTWIEVPQDSLPVTRVKRRWGRVKQDGRRTRLTWWSHFPSADVILPPWQKIFEIRSDQRVTKS